MERFKNTIFWMVMILIVTFLYIVLFGQIPTAQAKPPAKSKFYDFSDQLIDGQITKPTTLYTDARQKVKFERLLSLKKSFIPALLQTSKDPIFK